MNRDDIGKRKSGVDRVAAKEIEGTKWSSRGKVLQHEITGKTNQKEHSKIIPRRTIARGEYTHVVKEVRALGDAISERESGFRRDTRRHKGNKNSEGKEKEQNLRKMSEASISSYMTETTSNTSYGRGETRIVSEPDETIKQENEL